MKPRIWAFTAVVMMGFLLLGVGPAAAGMESENYRIQICALSSAGGAAGSAAYELNSDVGAPSHTQYCLSDNYIAFPGLWHPEDFIPVLFALLAPENGSTLAGPPTFEWSAGPYDLFLFFSIFNYAGYGYHPIKFWYLNTSLPMSAPWWNALSSTDPSYWFLIGLNTSTWQWDTAGPWSFSKSD